MKLPVVLLAALGCAPRSATRAPERADLCQELPRISFTPHKERPGHPAWHRIEAAGCAAVPCLLERITDAAPAPAPPGGACLNRAFAVGDMAVFLLDEITGASFERLLPEAVQAQLPERGVYAYLAYVETPPGRAELRARYRAWLAEHPCVDDPARREAATRRGAVARLRPDRC